jgi:hypothetical protein
MIKSYNHPGGWIVYHHQHRRAAAKSLWMLRKLEREYESRYQALVVNEDPDYAWHLLRPLREEGTELASSVAIYSAMTVEAFLNYYGVVRLGQTFFKANLERHGTTEKLSLLLALCDNVQLEKRDDLWKITRSLFDRRNALVHPKAREFDPDKLPSEENLVSTATSSYRQMRSFFKLFCGYAREVGAKGRHRRDLFTSA